MVEGITNASYKEINSKIQEYQGAPILFINLTHLKDNLEKITWIKKIVVKRKLPSTLCIEVIEHQPIAIWQYNKKLYLVDKDGKCIKQYEGYNSCNLIHVIGQNANICAHSLVQEISIYPDLAAKITAAVRYGNRRWNLHLKQNIIVKMPEYGFNVAYNFLSLLDQEHKLFDQNYKMLDLRDANKYFIQYAY